MSELELCCYHCMCGSSSLSSSQVCIQVGNIVAGAGQIFTAENCSYLSTISNGGGGGGYLKGLLGALLEGISKEQMGIIEKGSVCVCSSFYLF